MKKVNFILVNLTLLVFISCTKDFTCECKTVTFPEQTIISTKIIKTTKLNASKTCKNSSKGTGITCELK